MFLGKPESARWAEPLRARLDRATQSSKLGLGPPLTSMNSGMALANTPPSIGHITSFGVWQYGQVTPSGTYLILPWPAASICLLQEVQRTLFSSIAKRLGRENYSRQTVKPGDELATFREPRFHRPYPVRVGEYFRFARIPLPYRSVIE